MGILLRFVVLQNYLSLQTIVQVNNKLKQSCTTVFLDKSFADVALTILDFYPVDIPWWLCTPQRRCKGKLGVLLFKINSVMRSHIVLHHLQILHTWQAISSALNTVLRVCRKVENKKTEYLPSDGGASTALLPSVFQFLRNLSCRWTKKSLRYDCRRKKTHSFHQMKRFKRNW